AAQVASNHPEVGATERDRYRVVLLDEYQDTSHAQVVLLRSLFGLGHPVTAVGDPCQSIYGWRGASAGTLDRFPAEFPDRTGRPARQLALSTSWRNRPEILRVANALSDPLRTYGHQVARLTAAPVVAPRAGGIAALRRDREALTGDRLEDAALAEALDDLGEPDRYSPEGNRRFTAIGEELRRLRGLLDQPLPDLIAEVERTIGLDVEVAA